MKRPRKPKPPKPPLDAGGVGQVHPFPNSTPELGLFAVTGDEDDGFLFEPESVEELKAQAESDHTSNNPTSHNNNSQDDDEPEDFEDLAHLMDRSPNGGWHS